jgi:hypothetical protein
MIHQPYFGFCVGNKNVDFRRSTTDGKSELQILISENVYA